MNRNKSKVLLIISLFAAISVYGQTEVELDGKGSQTKTYKTSTGVTSTELEYRGKILFNDEETDVTFISPGGFIKFSKKTFGNRRTIELEGESNGGITRTYREGGTKIPFEPNGRKWMASVLPEIIRSTGIGADERVKKFYAKGGLNAVLNEIDEVSGDYVQNIYYSATLDLPGLSTADIRKVLEHAEDELSSSYEQSKMLINNSAKFQSSEANLAIAIGFIADISSSYEQAKCYKHFLTSENLSEANKALIIQGVSEISSSYEQSQVLVELVKGYLSQHNVELVISQIPNVSSSYEQSKVLSNLVKNQEDLNNVDFEVLLEAIYSISSSYEQGKVLNQLISERELTTSQIISVAKASTYISSDYEQAKVIQNLVNKQELSRESIEAILEASRAINSSFESSKILKMIASSDSFSAENFDTLLDHAADISSSYDQSRVLEILTQMEGLADEDQLALIETIGEVSSTYERSKLLISLGPNLSDTKTVRETFLNEARTLSDTDFGKVMRSMDY